MHRLPISQPCSSHSGGNFYTYPCSFLRLAGCIRLTVASFLVASAGIVDYIGPNSFSSHFFIHDILDSRIYNGLDNQIVKLMI